MIEKMTYINHMNEVIEFGSNGIYVNENDLHDFAWSVISKNDKISSLKKGVTKHQLPVIIICNTDSEGIAARNKLFEVCEKDVLALKHGKLKIGDYYLRCYVTGSKVNKYTYNKMYAKITLTIQTDYPQWVKETTLYFGGKIMDSGTDMDYNSDFPFDYASNVLANQLVNPNFVSSNFKMNIYGAISNPEIIIAGHVYSVNKTVESNQYLTIDSVEKTVTLTDSTGTTENCFNLRNKDSYVFEKIPAGISNVSTNGEFKFDITLLEERGVPKWI